MSPQRGIQTAEQGTPGGPKGWKSSGAGTGAGTFWRVVRARCVTLGIMTRPPPVQRARWPELDELTLVRAQRGEAQACRALVQRYQRQVFALLSRLLSTGGLASSVEDLAQETFLRVFRELSGFSPHGPARLSSWILTIATRLGIDALRSRARRVTELDAEATVSEGPCTDEGAERNRTGNAIEHAIAQLSPEFRATFLLRAYHELEYQEIADALGCDLGTVKSRISRARAQLREALSEVKYG